MGARVRAALRTAPWTLTAGRSVSPDGRTVFSVEGTRFVTRRVHDGSTVRDEAAPGADCTLAAHNGGVGAVCTRAWARVVLTRGVDEAGWHVLRDERDAAPVAEVRFDARSPLWVTAAPCAQGEDPRGALCVTDARGTARTLRVTGALVAAHAGEVLVHDAGRVVAVDAEGHPRARSEAALPARRGLTAVATRAGLAVIPAETPGGARCCETRRAFAPWPCPETSRASPTTAPGSRGRATRARCDGPTMARAGHRSRPRSTGPPAPCPWATSRSCARAGGARWGRRCTSPPRGRARAPRWPHGRRIPLCRMGSRSAW
ncbi:MAG: hypothetical protein U0325_35125 [Polyangiales bacterium]